MLLFLRFYVFSKPKKRDFLRVSYVFSNYVYDHVELEKCQQVIATMTDNRK